MTEVGLVLSNPLNPESERRPGCVGLPFEGVCARIVDEQGTTCTTFVIVKIRTWL